jgi:hypothetical protein
LPTVAVELPEFPARLLVLPNDHKRSDNDPRRRCRRTLRAMTFRSEPEPDGSALWTTFRCSRCAYVRERPGGPTADELDAGCALCGTPLRSVTTVSRYPP